MRIVYTPTADRLKRTILAEYSGIGIYFDQIEKNILQSPYRAAEEKIVIDGTTRTAYKKNVKTGLFSGNIIVSYLYLSLSYCIHEARQQIIIIGAYVRYGISP
jgi:hypothetical protein